MMRASYDSIDNKQKMCEKVNKDITFIQFFHSTRLHSTELFKIFFSLLTLQLLFCKKLVGREKKNCHLGVIHKRRPQEGGRGVKGKETRADIGGGRVKQGWTSTKKF